MTNQPPESAQMEYITVIAPNNKQLIETENGINDIPNNDNAYIDDFIAEMKKPANKCSCCAACNLWIGVHIWLLLFIIGDCYNIYTYKTILDVLNLTIYCPEIQPNGPALQAYNHNKPLCLEQEALINAGYTTTIVQFYCVFYGIGLVIYLAAFYGIYRCFIICICAPIIFILLATISDLYWLIITNDFILILALLIRLWPTIVFFKACRLAYYFKNGGVAKSNQTMPQ